MRIAVYIVLVLFCQVLVRYALPGHCLGAFRVRNLTIAGIGGTYGVEQYGFYSVSTNGITPIPMNTCLYLGPLGSMSLENLAVWAASLVLALGAMVCLPTPARHPRTGDA
jgi:hypothetical protein